MSDGLLFAVLPFITAAALGFGLWFVVRERNGARREVAARRLVEPDLATPPRDAAPPERPWWGSPWLWLAVCAVFLVLGLVVWPGLFGGTLIFLPFLWIVRPRRPPEVDPRTNGHGRRGGRGSFTSP